MADVAERDAYASRNAVTGKGFRVAREQCASCIFGPNSAIKGRPERMRDLAETWARDDAHQVCHAFGTADEDDDGDEVLYGENVACRGWWDTQTSNLARMAERMGRVSFESPPEKRA